jgi:ethanolamine utilization microcompartment shell protein EutS
MIKNNCFELRTILFIDSLQPQITKLIAASDKVNKVCDPTEYEAGLVVEIAPAMEIHSLLDVALKRTSVRLGCFMTERRYGVMCLHHADQGEVKEAGRAILQAVNLEENDRAKALILTNKIIRAVEQDHTTMFNNMARVSKVNVGESVLIMETTPATYLTIACNEALKAARVKLIHLEPVGASGRLILSGSESEIDSAALAAKGILDKLNEMQVNKSGRQLG